MEPTHIYHEKQVAQLCGVHCLNTLLQGSYFNEIDLATVALDLDKKEKSLMMEMGTDTHDFLRYMGEDSGNVSDSGNYSVQVLEKCLSDGWNLKCLSVSNQTTPDVLQNPLTENAFICNLSNHWFTIRKIGQHWYNLNSLADYPQRLSDFYLSLYLGTLLGSGWSVFVIKGDLPPVIEDAACAEGGRWVPLSKCEPPQKTQKQQPSEEDEMKAAIALSLQENQSSKKQKMGSSPRNEPEERDENDAELQAVLEASELEAAIAASLQQS